MLSFIELSVAQLILDNNAYTVCYFNECRKVECRFSNYCNTEYCFVDCRYAECRYCECRGAVQMVLT